MSHAEMTDDSTTLPTWTPPRWLNYRIMAVRLHTPRLGRLIGASTALITVTGHRTGARYTTPVNNHRDRDTVLVITKPCRTWWRNLDFNPMSSPVWPASSIAAPLRRE